MTLCKENLRVWQFPLFNHLRPKGMDSNDFQCIHGRRGLNTIERNQKFSLLGDNGSMN